LSPRGEIGIEVLGDSALFSAAGKGVTYLVAAGPTRLLLECGANPFWRLGPEGVAGLGAVIVTHAHFDHHRYLTELALYSRYVLGRPLTVLATAAVAEDLKTCCAPALTRTLSDDARRVVDSPFGEFIRFRRLGPLPRYRLEFRAGAAGPDWRAVDARTGRAAPPRLAKAVLGPAGAPPRLLVRDRESGAWVDPECFYAFSERAFYPGADRVWRCPRSGLVARALNAPSWHGPSSSAVLFERGGACAAFSGDTVYDPDLWAELAGRRRRQRLPTSRRSFLAAPVLRADINRLIERVWSRRRLAEAISAYDRAVVFHDADYPGSVVHTIYAKLSAAAGGASARWRGLVLTHTPERFTALHPVAYPGARFRITAAGLAGLRGAPAAWHKQDGKVYSLRPAARGRLAIGFADGGLRLEKLRGRRGGLEMKLETGTT
jgi:glyoxylase-like metal-dependent hydrolase (beta-lactamase superfamily II)